MASEGQARPEERVGGARLQGAHEGAGEGQAQSCFKQMRREGWAALRGSQAPGEG